MDSLLAPLRWSARAGKAWLIVGLLAGLLLPDLAHATRPWLPQLVGLLLFLVVLRIGPQGARALGGGVPQALGISLTLQLALPLTMIAVMTALGLLGQPIATALILMTASGSILGAPNLALMLGLKPEPLLRLLIVGTVILPFTVLPVFWLLPDLGSAEEVIAATLRLVVVIAGSMAAALAIRHWLMPSPSAETTQAIDGASAVGLAVIVVGLMTAVGDAAFNDPARLLVWLAIAYAANFGLQIIAHFAFRGWSHGRGSEALSAGNRNIALFLVALPDPVTDPILLFIGCYQIPMYTTPLLLGWLYRAPRG